MKKATLGIIALTTLLFVANGAWAQQGTVGDEQQKKLVRVSTLNSIESNQEFQRNVQVLQVQRQRAVQLNTAIEEETNADKKAELEEELEALIAKLNDNNEKMLKTYGFSLTRNYTLVVEKAHVYMFVTDEEAEQIEKNQAAGK